MNLSHVHHPSVEILSISLKYKEDRISIVNIYRHPNTNTPVHILREIFGLSSSLKYVLFVEDLNAHHSSWYDSRSDYMGNRIAAVIDDRNLTILNDDSPTRIDLVTHSPSIIDLAIASRNLAFLCTFSSL